MPPFNRKKTMKKIILTLTVIISCFSVQCIRSMEICKKDIKNKAHIVKAAMYALQEDDLEITGYKTTKDKTKNKCNFKFSGDTISSIEMILDSSRHKNFEEMTIIFSYKTSTRVRSSRITIKKKQFKKKQCNKKKFNSKVLGLVQELKDVISEKE